MTAPHRTTRKPRRLRQRERAHNEGAWPHEARSGCERERKLLNPLCGKLQAKTPANSSGADFDSLSGNGTTGRGVQQQSAVSRSRQKRMAAMAGDGRRLTIGLRQERPDPNLQLHHPHGSIDA